KELVVNNALQQCRRHYSYSYFNVFPAGGVAELSVHAGRMQMTTPLDDERIGPLQMLGLSEAILRLAAGEDLHPGLSECYQLPPQVNEPPVFTMHGRRKYYQCHRQLPALEEPFLPADASWFIPLWAFRGGITGIW